MHIGKAVADQSHVTIPKGPEEVHTPEMKQIMHERKKKLSTSSPRVSEIEIMILNRLSKFRS